MAALSAVSNVYSECPFEELINKRKVLVSKMHGEFSSGHRLSQCVRSLSSQQSSVAFNSIQELRDVLQELNKRKEERNSTLCGFSYNAYLRGVKGLLHFSFLSAITLDFTSIFVDCKKAEYLEITSIACATAAVGLSILNKWGEDKLAKIQKELARLENCSVEELSGVDQLCRFLNSFVELVMFLQIKQAEKSSQLSSNSSGDFVYQSNLPFSKATLDFISAKFTALGLKQTNKKELVKACILNLFAVPDFILESFIGDNAVLIRKMWIQELTAMANVSYVASRPEGLDFSSSFVENNNSVEINVDEIQPEGDLNKLSLHKLIQLYKDEIKKFHDHFNLDLYLSNFVSGQSEENDSAIKEQKQIVDDFIVKLKDLHQIITTREKKYERTHCFPCLSPKKKEDILYGTKHVSTVIFFASTSIAGVTHCVEGFGIRDIGKIIAVVSGLCSMALEGLCSWTTSRDLNNKIARAKIIQAEISDLDDFDRFNAFVNAFLVYVEEIGELKQMIDQGGDSSFKTPLNNELRGKIQTVTASLENCEDCLHAVDKVFLEQLMKGNGNTIKQSWQNSLRLVYDKLTNGLMDQKRKKRTLITRNLFHKSAPSTLKSEDNKQSIVPSSIKPEDSKNEEETFEIEGKNHLNPQSQTVFIVEDNSVEDEDNEGSIEEENNLEFDSDEEILYDNECTANIVEEIKPEPREKATCLVQ